MIYVAVFVGGAIGALVRYAFAQVEALIWRNTGRPNDGRGTLAANVLACALVGAMVTVFSLEDDGLVEPLLVAGLCGGMSTFSSLALEVFSWLEEKRYSRAIAMVVMNCALGGLAFAFGLQLFS